MTALVRFNVEFNLNLRKSISFVCQSGEYNALCTKLGRCFEHFEKEQFKERSGHDGMLPEERLYHRLTWEGSIFQQSRYTSRQSDKSITIMISRDEDDEDMWKFLVVDLRGKKHWVFHRNPKSHEPVNWRPGEYNAHELLRSIGVKYAFEKLDRKK